MQKANRPGFLDECLGLCTEFDIDADYIFKFDPDSNIENFGNELKSKLYRKCFQVELKAILKSNQASILARLFPPKASYYCYRALDLVERVLHREERTVRSSFFRNLCGASHLANCIHSQCRFCKKRIGNIGHYIFDCEEIEVLRNKFLRSIGKQLAISNPTLFELWQDCSASILDVGKRQTACAILFGGNFAINSDGEWSLFRKSHYKAFHHSDRIPILTGRFLMKLNTMVQNRVQLE